MPYLNSSVYVTGKNGTILMLYANLYIFPRTPFFQTSARIVNLMSVQLEDENRDYDWYAC